MVNEVRVSEHYSRKNLFKIIKQGLIQEGVDLDLVSPEDLSSVDEFHIGGIEGTRFVSDKLGLSSMSKVLDIGCGIGGPARFIAETYKSSVTGIDLTASYVKAGVALNELVGLSGKVNLLTASALEMPFCDNHFDATYMIHVGMNIANKKQLMSEAFRVTKPDGFFVLYDVMKLEDVDIEYPLPWADKKSESAVELISNYESALENAGFHIVEKENKTKFAITFFQNMIANTKKNGPTPLGLHLLMGDNTSKKISNIFRQIQDEILAPTVIISKK
tara:strand:- start:287 stop:1111 length:825 start_codon:yes stop_codon:yes gene_type:complete